MKEKEKKDLLTGIGSLQCGTGIGDRLRILVLHGQCDREIRLGNAAPLEHAGGLRGVAGHVGGEHDSTDLQKCIIQGYAGLCGAA